MPDSESRSATANGKTRATSGPARETWHRAPVPCDDDGLHGLLLAIAEDVQRQAGAVADGIRAEFAIRILDATRRTPRRDVGAIVSALRELQRAALAAVSREAATEIRGRQQAAIKNLSRRYEPATSRHAPISAAPLL